MKLVNVYIAFYFSHYFIDAEIRLNNKKKNLIEKTINF